MKVRQLLLGSGLLLIAALLGGCVAETADRSTPTGATFTKDPGELAFQYRQQAAGLRDMARRLELEAEWYATVAKDEERAKRSREMATSFRATADEAEEQAREYRRQVPPTKIY